MGVNVNLESKFKQQELDAWQPILTPTWVIVTFLVVAVVFIPVGFYLKGLSDDVKEFEVVYDSYDNSKISFSSLSGGNCQITTINQGFNEMNDRSGSSPRYDPCVITFTINKDIASDEEVYVYFQIDNFYQNHRRYVKSRDDNQLRDDGATDLKTNCDPQDSYQAKGTNRTYYPCGLIATSYFNDGIRMASITLPESGTTNYSLNNDAVGGGATSWSLVETGIAWESDLEKKFKNPTGNFQYYNYAYLWQLYDQALCVQNLEASRPGDVNVVPCQSYGDLNSTTLPGAIDVSVDDNSSITAGCAQCPSGSLFYVGGIEAPGGNDGTSPENLTENSGGNDAPYGLRTEHFVVWMRTAGLPTFRKLFGQINHNNERIPAGTEITFEVTPNFLVQTFDGTKSLVVGTVSPLGGKNDVLGWAYITVGLICAFLCLLFLIKLKVSPRALGDPSYLHWKSQ